jgi:hypothetical protein
MTGMPRPQQYAPALLDGLADRYTLGEVFDAEADSPVFAVLERRQQPHGHGEQLLYRFSQHVAEAVFDTPLERARIGHGGRTIPPSVSLRTWPFERPVISFPAAPMPGASRLQFALDADTLEGLQVSEGRVLRLRFAVAMNPDEWRSFMPTALRFRVTTGEEIAFEHQLDPRRDLGDRRWVHADLPLDPAKAERIRFEIATDNGYGTSVNLGGFADPRIVAVVPR